MADRSADDANGEHPPEPSFLDLVRGNVRVLAWIALFTAGAWLVWRGLAWLFPDVGWLQIPRRGR